MNSQHHLECIKAKQITSQQLDYLFFTNTVNIFIKYITILPISTYINARGEWTHYHYI